MVVDYRTTPHSTTGISPFTVMFGRKARGDVRKLHPRPSELPTKAMNRDEVERKQLEMKRYRDSKRTPALMKVKIADWVRVQGQYGITKDYDEIIDMGERLRSPEGRRTLGVGPSMLSDKQESR